MGPQRIRASINIRHGPDTDKVSLQTKIQSGFVHVGGSSLNENTGKGREGKGREGKGREGEGRAMGWVGPG
jgi:hypothetical protein